MAKKKSAMKKKSAKKKAVAKKARKKPVRKKAAPKKLAARKAPARKRLRARGAAAKGVKPVRGKNPRPVSRKRATRRRLRPIDERQVEELGADFPVMEPLDGRGLGPESGGQAGDTEGLSRSEIADSESVAELIEEGQAFEAGVISGVENAPDADQGGVKTREVPEDDVPQEYLDRD